MDRQTRDKFASRTSSDLTTGNARWETAPLVYKKLNEDFGPFDIDLTADAGNFLHDPWFGPGSPYHEDAITAQWHTYGKNGYSNPSYGPFVQWMLEKAKREASAFGFTSTLLLPMRVTVAFRQHVLRGAAELLFADSRLVFFEGGAPRINAKKYEQGKLVPDPAMFDSIIVRYQPGIHVRPKIGEWHVPMHVTLADLERASNRIASHREKENT
jgi:hypothetical protein